MNFPSSSLVDDTPRPKILVVDDVSANLAAMRRLLGSVTADVYEASSGNEALALCLDHSFALILLDAHMPDMDGFEVARHLADDPDTSGIPVIFVTAAYIDDLNRLKGYTFGAVDYIAKPINDAVLLSKVTVFLELHSSKLRLTAALEELERRNRQLENEIDERRRIEQQIRHMATHDALTGLGNRILFLEHLARESAYADRHGQKFALLFIDIDGFKQINDTHGHATGDFLLATIAQRLRTGLRQEDIIARLSGDEFAVLMSPVFEPEHVLRKAEDLAQHLSRPYTLAVDGRQAALRISASIGVAIYPIHSANRNELIRLADAAMYSVKQGGKNGARLFGHEPGTPVSSADAIPPEDPRPSE